MCGEARLLGPERNLCRIFFPKMKSTLYCLRLEATTEPAKPASLQVR